MPPPSSFATFTDGVNTHPGAVVHSSAPSSSTPSPPGLPEHGERPCYQRATFVSVPQEPSGRVAHEASVFVGNLPTHVEHGDLIRLLHSHLSPHQQVRGIKIVRDGKGGVCGFIQCQNTEAAASLLEELHTSPLHNFMDRQLRFEAAHAFRTLLVSYHSPVDKYISDAVRLCRSGPSKFVSITFGDEARTSFHGTPLDTSSADKLSGRGILVSPVTFDLETITVLASAFGPLEYIKPHRSHRGTLARDIRGPHVHAGSTCWEIKWAQRDACVGALSTFRRIPWLSATWAHHPSGTPPVPLRGSLPPITPQGTIQTAATGCIEAMPASLWGDLPSTPSNTVSPTGVIDLCALGRRASPTPRTSFDAREVPDLTHSPVTPCTPLSAGMPPTPLVNSRILPATPSRDASIATHERSVFIGGLEPRAWDEKRLRSVFSQYGIIEDIQIIKPIHQKTAFAFVRYGDGNEALRAVAEERGKIYEGYHVRVQIRDNAAPRTIWKPSPERRATRPPPQPRTTQTSGGLTEGLCLELGESATAREGPMMARGITHSSTVAHYAGAPVVQAGGVPEWQVRACSQPVGGPRAVNEGYLPPPPSVYQWPFMHGCAPGNMETSGPSGTLFFPTPPPPPTLCVPHISPTPAVAVAAYQGPWPAPARFEMPGQQQYGYPFAYNLHPA